MPAPRVKETGYHGPREPPWKSAPGSGAREKRAPAVKPPKPGWALTAEGLEAMCPAQRHRHLLFGDLLQDVSEAASIFPCDSPELVGRMPDPRMWAQPHEEPAQQQNRLLGVLKAAEARGRVRALRLRYTRLRAEEIALLIRQQKSARAALRLEIFLPPLLKPRRIPDPLDRQEVPAGLGKGRGGVLPLTHSASAPCPTAEASGNHTGGERGRQHLPPLTATQTVGLPSPHIKYSLSSRSSLVFLLSVLPRTLRRNWNERMLF
ncbi:PREDICTED: LOW QUALITY PROTEIN: uncharacterized protein C20orf201 homolog [Elephantulus edwardii]|uniref:LOW QUALITY PROTEIN: uncharacterized protein C20orf201 homolog n=1 Tax=Elephantulus edwardii TaxID=28737 RepID=UPI0003F06A8F|nr:PREDICTED: LOW QUALITY PROTEIN: uncharacterized protein C20orf201 homolog [Elephantulus edwardii]